VQERVEELKVEGIRVFITTRELISNSLSLNYYGLCGLK
jgi:hypothetical protein